MGKSTMQRRAQAQLSASDLALYREGGSAQIGNSILKELLAERHNIEEPGLPAAAHVAILTHTLALSTLRDDLAQEHKASTSLGATLDAVDGSDLAASFEGQVEQATDVIRSSETAIDVGERGAKAAFYEANDDEKDDIASMFRLNQSLQADLGAARSDFAHDYCVPGLTLVQAGAPLSDELERTRPDVRVVLQMADALQAFDPGGQDLSDLSQRIASITEGAGSAGKAAFILRKMFEARLPYDLCEAFANQTGLSVAKDPEVAFDALRGEGRDTGDAADLTIELTSLAKIVGAQGHTFTLSTMPDLGSLEHVKVWSGVVGAHNHMVDYQGAMARLMGDEQSLGSASDADDVQTVATAPLAALEAWESAQIPASDFTLVQVDGLKDWKTNMQRALAQGRLEARARQGFVLGVDDDATVLDVTLGVAEQALKLHEQAADDAMNAGLAAVQMAGPHAVILSNVLKGIKAGSSLADKYRVIREYGLMSEQGGDAAGQGAMAVIGLSKATSGAVATAVTVIKSVKEAQLTSFDTNYDYTGLFGSVRDVQPKRLALVNDIARLEKALSVAGKVGAIGDIAGVIGGVVKIIDGDTVGGALDIAGGALGLASLAAGATGLGSGAAIGVAGGTLSTIAGPLGLGISFLTLIHTSLRSAHAGFRAVAAKRAGLDMSVVIKGVRFAENKLTRANHAVELEGRSAHISEAEREVYQRSLIEAYGAMGKLYDECLDAFDTGDLSDALTDNYAGWTDKRKTLSDSFDSTVGDAYDDLQKGRTGDNFQVIAESLGPAASPIAQAAGDLATELASYLGMGLAATLVDSMSAEQ